MNFTDYIIHFVDLLCPPKKKPLYTTLYYLNNMIDMLKNRVSWNSLIFHDKPKHHNSTIRKMFLKWSKLNIFQLAYKKILDDNYIPILDERNRINLIIDSSKIYNRNGIELIGKDYENPKKRVTKISIITDINKTPLNVEVFRGTEHDTNTIIGTYNGLPKYVKGSTINLIVDKGYKLKEIRKKKLYKRKILLCVPRRKNEKKRNLDSYKKELLETRYKIEHSIEQLKKYNRICIRRDKLITTYKSFIFMGLIINAKNYF